MLKRLRTFFLWIVTLPLLLAILGLLLFGAFAIGELAPTIALYAPLGLLYHDVTKYRAGKSDKSLSFILLRIPLLPFIILAWISPLIAFNQICRAFGLELEGTTMVMIGPIPAPAVPTGAWLAVPVAALGLGFAAWTVFDVVRLIRRRTRMLDETATTPVGELGPGHVELVGTARHVDPDSGDDPILRYRTKSETDQISESETIRQPFYLEQGSDRILVDPADATFLRPDDPPISPHESPHMIVLTGGTTDDRGRTTRTLRDGETVYLFGTALTGTGKSGELVVRPEKRTGEAGLLNRLLHLVDREILSRDPRHMFLLIDAKEERMKQFLRSGIRSVLLFSLIWIVPALALLAVAVLRHSGFIA